MYSWAQGTYNVQYKNNLYTVADSSVCLLCLYKDSWNAIRKSDNDIQQCFHLQVGNSVPKNTKR